MPTPHRMVDSALDGLAEGAKGLLRTVTGGLKGAGESVCGALDRPPSELGGPEGPHRIADRVLDGEVDAGEKAVNEGIIGSLQVMGEGIARGLDQPVEQFGVPPDLGRGELGRVGPGRLPWRR